MATSNVDIIQAIDSPKAFRRFFPGDLSSWESWFSFLRVIYGLGLTPDDLELFRACTERETPDENGYDVIYLISGRKSGKSTVCGLIAAFTAIFGNWGEDFSILVVAPTIRQAKMVFRSARQMLSYFPGAIKRETGEEIDLKNGGHIFIRTPSYKHIRGENVALAILDEFALFESEGALPADELAVAIEPSLLPNAKLIYSSTAFGKAGPLWDAYERHWSLDDAELVWKSSTAQMNPTFSTAKIDKAVRSDPSRFRAEYLSEFRDDISRLFADGGQVTRYCTGSESEPRERVNYYAFLDASSGGKDSMALAIAHGESGRVHLDLIRENKAPFNDAEKIIGEYADILKRYHVGEVLADKHAQAFVGHLFGRRNISVKFHSPSATDLYLFFAGHLRAGDLVLLNDKTLIDQLAHLRRKISPGGGERIDSPAHKLDDVANAAAGAVWHYYQSVNERQPVEGVVVRRREHPDLQREKELAAKEELENCEKEMQDYINETEGGLGIPLKPGHEYFPVKRP
jgi:hypothetical protein